MMKFNRDDIIMQEACVKTGNCRSSQLFENDDLGFAVLTYKK